MERTGTTSNPRQGTHGMDIRGGEIHKEPDGTLALMLARFPHESETPIHNHNSWGVVCVVAGRDRYVTWQRLDDASRAGHAQVRVASERVLDPGDVVHFADSPEDIHSQQGVGAPVWELVFFGRDPNVKPRLYFDAKAETVRAAPACGEAGKQDIHWRRRAQREGEAQREGCYGVSRTFPRVSRASM